MKKQKLLNNLKHRLSLLLCLMAFLAVGQSAWGTTYYVYMSNNDNPSTMTKVGSTTGTSYTISRTFETGKNYYVMFLTTDQTPSSSTSVSNQHIKNKKSDYSVSAPFSWIGKKSYNLSSADYSFIGFAFTNTDIPSSVTVSISNTSGSNPTQADYTVTAGGAPTPTTTWTLRGEITGGFSTPVTFEGSDVEKSCVVTLPVQVYPQGQTNKGFKIVKNDGSDTWYGAKTTITRGNNSATFQTGSGDEWNCGLNADIAGNYTFTITNLTGNPELTITYPQSTYPIARWGAAPTIDGSKNINASAYVATHGCNGSEDYTVTQLRVRYWKEGDVANAEVIETEEGTYAPGTAYPITIPYTSNVLINCTTESKIIMEVAAKNDLGWSSYSDRMAVMYTAGTTFVTHNLEKDFTACEGNHQFTLSEMVGPVPDSWSVVISGGADAKSEFTLVDGEMIWNPGDKTSGTYNYTFTFTKEGYPNGTATLKITYTKTAPSGEIGDISASSTSVSKYTPVTLSATKGTGVTKIKWSVTPNTFITETDANHATFQGKAVTTYTVTAVGLSTSCGETAAKTKQITVTKDTEECNE